MLIWDSIAGITEVFDRLMCTFGQDALDSLYLATRTFASARTFALFWIIHLEANSRESPMVLRSSQVLEFRNAGNYETYKHKWDVFRLFCIAP